MQMLTDLTDSGPGPDYIRYSGWACAPLRARQALYIAYWLWIGGGPLPQDFNYSFLCLLAKGSKVEDSRMVVREVGR